MLEPYIIFLQDADEDTIVETGPLASSLPLALLGYTLIDKYIRRLLSVVSIYSLFRTLSVRNPVQREPESGSL